MGHEGHPADLAKGGVYSRREFLRVAGLAGAAIGLGAGMGGLLAACGEEEATTTSAESAQTTATTAGGQTTTSVAGSTTSVSAAEEMGEKVKVGFVSALTGANAVFGKPDKWVTDRWLEAIGDGLICGDGKKHPLDILMVDTQSNSNRAAQVAGDLAQNDGVQMMVAGGPGDTSIPVSDQCEALGVPSFTTDTIWQAWFNNRQGDPKVGFKWTYHAFFATNDSFTMYFAMWDKVPNNKVYGALWPNDVDGNIYRKLWPPALEEAGYTLVDGGSFSDGTEDYTSVINAFKAGGAEICAGLMTPPDFTNFWTQAKQQGYNPKICSIGKALNFPEATTALGDLAIGLSAPCYWNPAFPFESSLTGETCRQLADDYEAKEGSQWNQGLEHYVLAEVATDTLKRCTDPLNKVAVLEALQVTKLDTVVGPIDFTLPVEPGTNRPCINACRTPLIGAQWQKGTGKWPYDLLIVSNTPFEDIPVEGQMVPLP